MGKIVKELWIITENGTVLFHHALYSSVDPDIFGGLMSALNSFSEVLTEGGLANIDLDYNSFYFFQKKDIIFIANCFQEIKEKKIMQILNRIAIKFYKVYNKEIKEGKHTLGQISSFADFAERSKIF